MLCLDTSFLLDYLDGDERTKAFVDENAGRPLFAPSIVLFELYRGAAHAGGPDQLERLSSNLEWIRPLEHTDETAREAALIEAELLERGDPVNLGDVLVAGVCRQAGGTLVTRDRDFERIPDLEVEYVPPESLDDE